MRSARKRNMVFSSLAGLAMILSYQNCGKGFQSADMQTSSLSSSSGNPNPSPNPSPGPAPVPLPVPAPLPVPVPVGGTITDLKVQNTGSLEQIKVPVSFGQVFALGSVAKTDQLAAKIDDQTILPVQMDAKATYPDGSVRHAVLSAVLPKLAAGQTLTLSLTKSSASGASNSAGLNVMDLVNAGFSADVIVNISGQVYSASADELLKGAQVSSWLSGPISNEWLVSTPLKTSAGVAHPHLSARFAVRGYAGLSRAKVDVVIENSWAYEANPQDFTYDVQVLVGENPVYQKTGLRHYTKTRWKKSFWWGEEPKAHLKHNTEYLIATRAFVNYDRSIPVAETYLANLKSSWTGAKIEPMGAGIAQPYMPNTGGRPDIGLLPAWAAAYLLSMDIRAREVTLGNADLAGSWAMHFRDKNKDLPISLKDYPYMTIAGNPGDTYNPVTKKTEDFPKCAAGACTNPNVADTSHQPNFAYLPYVLTGEHFYLEELQFLAMYSSFVSNPHFRSFEKGLVKSDQVRGQAWTLRTVAEAAAFSPDDHPLKAAFMSFVDENLNWYNAEYTNNPNANALGIITNGYAVVYNMGGDSTGIAPWQDDFFTQSVGHVAELGFTKALPLLQWKSKFQIGRMTDPNYCWIFGANYSLKVRDSNTSPFYTTLKQSYDGSIDPAVKDLPCGGPEMAAKLSLKVGEMVGYSDGYAGFPSNYQPGLAMAVDSGHPKGAEAWQKFMSRSVKPDYQNGPEFSVVPRKPL